jgi:phosphoribosylglycinamide formyltransferase-1
MDLPEAAVPDSSGQHSAFEVRGKKFAYFLVDHHGDGRVAINCKVPPGVMGAMVDANAEPFFVPAYLGARGWVGVDLNAPGLNWDVVERLIRESYQMIAPKQLAARARTAL